MCIIFQRLPHRNVIMLSPFTFPWPKQLTWSDPVSKRQVNASDPVPRGRELEY